MLNCRISPLIKLSSIYCKYEAVRGLKSKISEQIMFIVK